MIHCPVPITDYPTVLLAHGGGGRLSRMLTEGMFLKSFDNPILAPLHDGAVFDLGRERVAFSTDTFVVSPLFFPGGDIGCLAVHGTVNDLAMCGARPVALSVGMILEEGLPMPDLDRIVRSMRAAADDVGVPIVTGDTKVVDRGKGDGVFINTTGIGAIMTKARIASDRVRVGDRVLLSGPIAEHGVAILSVREGLEFETELRSDTAPLHRLVAAAIDAGRRDVHMLRDPTRGGVASALNEIVAGSDVGILLEETSVPIGEEVAGACEILGLDPLYVACEGRCIMLVTPEAADDVLAAVREHPVGRGAKLVGEVVREHAGQVVMRSRIGGTRVVDMMSGEQLPRIC